MIDQIPEPLLVPTHAGSDIAVEPTAATPGTAAKYADIAISGGLFGAHTVNALSVRQAIWTRYGGFLSGNAILFGFSGQHQTGEKSLLAMFGVGLCIIWYKMLATDVEFLEGRFREANRFKWQSLGETANPFTTMLDGAGSEQGQLIFTRATYVIFLFLALHLFVAIGNIAQMFEIRLF